MLARVQQANQRLGGLLIELLNLDDEAEQAGRLREAAQHLGSLSAECFARAAEIDGRCLEAPARVVIDVDMP